MQSILSSPMISATKVLFSNIFIGLLLPSRIFFIFKKFSSPNLEIKKSENKIVLLGLLGALLGSKIVFAKLNFLFGYTYIYILIVYIILIYILFINNLVPF